MAEEKGYISYDKVTANRLLKLVDDNQGIFPFDGEPAEGSAKGVTSGAVYEEIRKLSGASSPDKGYYASGEALAAAWPSAQTGDIACVGTAAPYAVWRWNGSAWADSGEKHTPSFGFGDYYTKRDIDGMRESAEAEMERTGAGANYAVLDYVTSAAVTRLQVPEQSRKKGYEVFFSTATGVVQEVYVGDSIADEEWQKDGNWMPSSGVELADSYESDSKTAAPTADALHRLYVRHEEGRESLSASIDGLDERFGDILDRIAGLDGIGVSRDHIEVSAKAQDVKVYVACNGGWTAEDIPEGVEVIPVEGTGSGPVTVRFSVNESGDSEASGSFRITNGFGKERTVRFTQHAFVYELSVQPASLELGAAAGSGILDITSTRTPYLDGSSDGESEAVPFTLSSGAEWLHVQDTGEYTYDENCLESSRSASITVMQDGGKTVTVNAVQSAAVTEWVYEFSVSPQAVSLVNAGTAQTVEVTSRKQKRVNGVNEGDAVSVDWSSSVTVGFKISGNSISADRNDTENAKSGTATFTQNESGKTVTVAVTQAAGTVTWEYTFTVSPASLSFSEKGETKSVTVTSVKQKKINGVNDGDAVPVGYTRSNSGTGVSGGGSSVTVSENTSTSSRSGKAIFTQNESGKTAEVSLTQSAGKVTYTYSLSVSSQNVTLDAKGTAQTLTVTSKRQKYVNGKASGGLEDYDWNFDLQSGFTYTKVSQTQLRVNGSNNTTTSQKTGQCIIRQKTDGGKSATVNVTQSGGTQSYQYLWSYTPASLTLSGSSTTGTVSFQRKYQTLWNDVLTSEQNVSGSLSDVRVTKIGGGTSHVSASVSGSSVNVRRTGSPTNGPEMYSCQVSVPKGDIVPGSFQVVLQS